MSETERSNTGEIFAGEQTAEGMPSLGISYDSFDKIESFFREMQKRYADIGISLDDVLPASASANTKEAIEDDGQEPHDGGGPEGGQAGHFTAHREDGRTGADHDRDDKPGGTEAKARTIGMTADAAAERPAAEDAPGPGKEKDIKEATDVPKDEPAPQEAVPQGTGPESHAEGRSKGGTEGFPDEAEEAPDDTEAGEAENGRDGAAAGAVIGRPEAIDKGSDDAADPGAAEGGEASSIVTTAAGDRIMVVLVPADASAARLDSTAARTRVSVFFMEKGRNEAILEECFFKDAGSAKSFYNATLEDYRNRARPVTTDIHGLPIHLKAFTSPAGDGATVETFLLDPAIGYETYLFSPGRDPVPIPHERTSDPERAKELNRQVAACSPGLAPRPTTIRRDRRP